MSLELLQDIHLSDDSFWTEFQYYWKNGSYSRALQILEENQELVTKYVTAEWFNALTALVYQLETLPDDFNKKQIKVSYLPPDLEVGDIWFQLELGTLTIDANMFIIPVGSTSVVATYSNSLINAVAFKNNEEVLVNQVINETNHSVTFSIGESLDYPVICMVYYSNNSNLEINTVNFSIGDEMFVVGYSGEILSVMCLQDNKKNIIDIYDYNSNELFFKMNPATENGIIRICTIPNANLNEILNVSSGNLSGTILRLTCDGYMVNSILTQAGTLELGINNVSGSVVTFNDGVGGMALKSLSVNIDPVQDLHGYDNPWPAGGGKNLLNSQDETNGYIRGSDGAFVSGISAWRCSVVYSEILPNTDYILRKYATATSSVAGYAIYDENKNYIDGHVYTDGESVSIVTPQNARYIRASWGSNAATPVALMLATEADATFAPYSNICPISGWSECKVWVKPTHDTTADPTATIQLGQTVYGGTLDVTTGVLTVDRAMLIMDGSIRVSSVNYHSSSGLYYTVVSNLLTGKSTNPLPISDRFMSKSEVAIGNCYITSLGHILVAVLPDQSITTRKSATAWFESNPTTFVYELDAPITIPITPTEISTLLGQNNVWADTGDTSLEYYTISDSPSSTEELTVENFVLSDISFELNKAIISKNSNDSTIKCTLYYT